MLLLLSADRNDAGGAAAACVDDGWQHSQNLIHHVWTCSCLQGHYVVPGQEGGQSKRVVVSHNVDRALKEGRQLHLFTWVLMQKCESFYFLVSELQCHLKSKQDAEKTWRDRLDETKAIKLYAAIFSCTTLLKKIAVATVLVAVFL